jgi:hypothetical protein
MVAAATARRRQSRPPRSDGSCASCKGGVQCTCVHSNASRGRAFIFDPDDWCPVLDHLR